MDIAKLLARQFTAIIQWLTEDIQQAPQACRVNRNMQCGAGIVNTQPTMQATDLVQGNGAHVPFIDVLVDFEQVRLVIKTGKQRPLQGR